MSRGRALVLLPLAVFVITASCGAGAARERAGNVATPRREPGNDASARPVEIRGGSTRERAVLGEIVYGLGRTRIERIVIHEPDKRLWRPVREGDAALRITVAEKAIRGRWEAILVAGAFVDRSNEARMRIPVVLELPDDAFRLDGPGESALRWKPQDEEAVTREIHALAEEVGASLIGLEILRPYGLAVALRIQVDQPAAFLKTGLDRLLDPFVRERARYDGVYIQVTGEGGGRIYELGNTNRQRQVSIRVRRDLAGCVPMFPADPRSLPPPCPA